MLHEIKPLFEVLDLVRVMGFFMQIRREMRLGIFCFLLLAVVKELPACGSCYLVAGEEHGFMACEESGCIILLFLFIRIIAFIWCILIRIIRKRNNESTFS